MLLEARVPISYIAQKLRVDAIAVLSVAVMVELLVMLYRPWLPDVPVQIPTFLGTAIALILGFKLAHSYDRWWEARKVWGAIVNDSRTLMRQAIAFPSQTTTLTAEIGRRQIAWCYCLGQSLRGQDWTVGTIEYLNDVDRSEVSRHTNKPLAIAQAHAQDFRRMAEEQLITDFQRIALDDTVTRLVDAMGKAERIRGTVFPTTYRVYLHVFIYVFILTLSVALAEVEGLWGVIVTMLIATPFFLLEKTATFLQDPFSNRPTDTPVTAIAQTIEVNLRQLMGEDNVPAPPKPTSYFVM